MSCGEAEGASRECCKGLLLGGEGEDNREMDKSVRGVWIDERKHGMWHILCAIRHYEHRLSCPSGS